MMHRHDQWAISVMDACPADGAVALMMNSQVVMSTLVRPGLTHREVESLLGILTRVPGA